MPSQLRHETRKDSLPYCICSVNAYTPMPRAWSFESYRMELYIVHKEEEEQEEGVYKLQQVCDHMLLGLYLIP